MAVRERLLTAATAIFAQKGYAVSTVREIVAAAGVTKPALYYYFQNKEGIYLELMHATLLQFEELISAARLEQGAAGERILLLCDRLLVRLLENIDVARVMYSIYYGPPQSTPAFDCHIFHFKFRDAVRELIGEGIQEKEFRSGNVEDMTWAVLAAINIAIEVELCHPEMSLGREGLRRLLSLILDGLRTPA
jgi:AcrR family transcriptional regulator